MGAARGVLCSDWASLHVLLGFALVMRRCSRRKISSQRYREWSESLGEGLGKTVVELTGEAATDLKLLEKGQLVVSTAQHWDALSRRWKQRKNVQVRERGGSLVCVERWRACASSGRGGRGSLRREIECLKCCTPRAKGTVVARYTVVSSYKGEALYALDEGAV